MSALNMFGIRNQPGAVARSDARQPDTCMRTVAGSILTSGSIFSWSLVME